MVELAMATKRDSVALHSGDYVEKYNRKPLNRVKRLIKMMQIGRDDRVADFACGNGMLLQAIGSREGHYVGVDFSMDFIDSANVWATKSGLQNYEFVCADIIEFCARNPGQFDIGTTLDFSEHIDDELAQQIYSAIRKSLKPDGVLYVHTPNLDFFLELAKDSGLISQFPEHIAVRSGLDMVKLLEKAGFSRTRIKLRYIAHYNILKWLHPLSYIPVIGKFFQARLWIEARA